VSRFDDIYRRLGLPQVMGFLGSTVTYVGDEDASASITAIVGPEEAELAEFSGERQRHRHRTVEVLTADVAHPRHPHKITIDGEIWTVRAVLGVQAGKARLMVTRPERVESGGRREMGR
jgi:hypothetical protein